MHISRSPVETGRAAASIGARLTPAKTLDGAGVQRHFRRLEVAHFRVIDHGHMQRFLEGSRRPVPVKPRTKNTQPGHVRQEAKPRTIETPQEFYKRFTKKRGVRELLSRLAKK